MSATDDSRSVRWASTVIGRLAELGLTTDAKVGAAGGPSTSTMTAYRAIAEGRRGGLAEPRDDTFGKIDYVCQWEPGSARRLWFEGAQPGHARPSTNVSTPAGLIEFEVSNDLGVHVVVKGPLGNVAELEESVVRLMERMRREREELGEIPPAG